jgi:hypothetical protein
MPLFNVPGCDGLVCESNKPEELRSLPLGGNENAILCKACLESLMVSRRIVNKARLPRNEGPLPIVSWDSLAVYSCSAVG